jgi:putative zinc finger/helix-turn-helix YgiT family protein
MTCAACGAKTIRTIYETDTFLYGEGSQAVALNASIPVRLCDSCGFRFTDDVADEARHLAICRHLRVMTPSQIVSIRKRYDLSRAEFARLTRIGEASLARWENGEFIQNPANDSLLYLLSFSDNVERLRSRNFSTIESSRAGLLPKEVGESRVRLRALEPTSELILAAERFELRRTGT